MQYLVGALLLLNLSAYSAAQPAPPSDSVQVQVDPRIELMGVIQLLTDYPLVTNYESPYRGDVRTYFSAFHDHRAVRLFEEMDGEGFAFDAVPKAMLALTRPPELEPRISYPERALSAAGGADSLRQFVVGLRDFAETSDFQAFYRAHQGTYRALVDSARRSVGDAMTVLRNYTGSPLAGATIIIGPLLHDGGFAARYETETSEEAYALIGPTGVTGGLPTFGSPKRIAGLTWHEFSHTVVNPLTEKYRSEIDRYASLLAPIEEPMQEAGYTRWETVVNEHIIQAIEVRLAHRQFGEEAGEQELAEQKERGFRYIDPLVETLAAYEEDRSRFPTLADVYPRLIAAFDRIESSSL